MQTQSDVYIFGDQSLSVVESLQDLLLIKDNSPLASFLRDASSAILKEISSLPARDRQEFPDGETLGLLLTAVKNGKGHAALDSALLCTYEIGYYINLLAQPQRRHPPPNSSFFLGVCTGSLAAAAISCSVSVFDICTLGIGAVLVAFRQGLHVDKKASILGGSNTGSWSRIISSVQEDSITQILNEFSDSKYLSGPMRPYISAVGPNFVTVSGIPEILDEFSCCDAMCNQKIHSASTRGPYHADGSLSERDLEPIVDSLLDGIEHLERPVKTRIMSAASGSITAAGTFGAVMRESLVDILKRKLRIDLVADGMSALLSSAEKTATLVPVNTRLAGALEGTLSHRGIKTKIYSSGTKADKNASNQVPGPNDAEKIAIVGFSGRFPDADDLGEFWELLRQGMDVYKPIPEDRFERSHYDPDGKRKNTSKVQYGCWLKNAGLFDSHFFHMSPKEAVQTDPAQRMALLTAYEALEMAGIVPDRTPSTLRHRVGVFYGTTSNDWGEVNSSQEIDTYYIPGANRAFIPGRINYFFKFSGPSIAVDTACSSSLAAINIAITSLLKRDCDTAIAGGTNVLTNPDNFAGLDRGHFLSRTGNCKAFDDGADGYCRADGIGTLVLKRLPDALSDKDPIYGVILGAHTNHNAEAVSITRPLADAQEYLFKKIITETGISPHDVSYIEMHGTGTQAGDAVEMKSVLDTFAWDHSRPPDKKLHLGSVKANVGHSESASGVIALIKVLLMMRRNAIPPHCGIKTEINRHFPTDLENRGVRIAQTGEVSWPRPEGGNRRVFVNNFSAAGGNTSLLVEDGPGRLLPSRSAAAKSPSCHVVAVSARSSRALIENLESLQGFVDGLEDSDRELLPRLAYTTTARRIHHSHRLALVVDNLGALRQSLASAVASGGDLKPAPGKAPGVGFLFTGQGAQKTAMARGLYENFSSFRADITDFEAIVKAQDLPSMLPLITGATAVDELSPVVVQLGTCIIQIALARFWMSLGMQPQYVVGHSLGEYAALCVAGVLSIADTIRLCGQRAVLLADRCTPGTHGMVAVKESHQVLKAHLPPSLGVEVACINGSKETVLSGPNDTVDAAMAHLKQLGFKSTRLTVPFAFHSSQVDDILDDLEELASHATYHVPNLPVISTLLAKVVTDGASFGPKYLRRHCREPVNFLGAVKAAEGESAFKRNSVCVEIGAHPLLSRMIQAATEEDLCCVATLRRDEDCIKTLSESLAALHLAGVPVSWNEYHRDFSAFHNMLELPSYSWQLSNHWMTYQYAWCLTKGDEPAEDLPAPPEFTPPPVRLSDSVHQVINECVSEVHSSIVTQSNLHDGGLLPVIQNHKVNGLAMCPSTLYADIAFTLSKRMLSYRSDEEQGFMPNICDLVTEKALVLTPGNQQLFRAALDIDWTIMQGSLEIYSVDDTGSRTSIHSRCSVKLQDPQIFLGRWASHEYLFKRSINQMVCGISTEPIHHLHRGVAYKMFSSSVQYGPAFQGIKELWFDSEGLEATTNVCLPAHAQRFELDPFCCDSLGHITGLIMNCNDSLDLSEYIYINHGWSFLHISEPYQCNVNYQTYVKMRRIADDDSVYSGDVHVLKEGKIIAICGGVTFKRVPKKVLQALLASTTSTKAKSRPVADSTVENKTSTAAKPAVAPVPAQATKDPAVAPPAAAEPGTVKAAPSAADPLSAPAPEVAQRALEIMADEIGVKASDLCDSATFADLGIDSLMSLTILGEFREELDLDVPASQFNGFDTIKDLKQHLASVAPAASTAQSGDGSSEDTASDHASVSTSPSTIDTPPSSMPSRPPSPKYHVPRSTSTILQGKKTCRKTLFLFPDGAGSATSYVTLPQISSDLRVYGLNSPYLTKPKEFKCPLGGITDSYLTELRRRQPTGPYHLAGWSAGGVSAYDAAQKLVAQGEVVESLILIDSPNPVGLGKLPKRMYTFLEKSGIFGAFEESDADSNAPPDWLFQHFLVFIEALDRYRPTPFLPGTTPPTTIIWAEDGVCKSPDDPRPEKEADEPRGMSWLLDNRTDFGPNGWDEFLGAKNIRTLALPDANHFTMMREPRAKRLVEHIRKALNVCG